MAIPAVTYATNWTYYCLNIFQILGYTFIALWIIPPIHRLGLTVRTQSGTPLQPSGAAAGSAVFVIAQICSRNSVILLLPSLALAAVAASMRRPSIW